MLNLCLNFKIHVFLRIPTTHGPPVLQTVKRATFHPASQAAFPSKTEEEGGDPCADFSPRC